jgi:serine phosphatase RsbU (regulator of sigma subunit)
MPEFGRTSWLVRAIFYFASVVFLLIAIIYFYNIIKWIDYPDFGYMLRAATGLHIVGDVSENGRSAGLQVGDLILELNSKEYSSIEEMRKIQNRELGNKNILHIQRNGKNFYVTIENIPSGLQRSFITSGIPFLIGICYATIGVLIFLMKPQSLSSRMFLSTCFIFGLFLLYFSPLGKFSPSWFETPNIFAYCFTPAVFIHLAFLFPQERAFANKFRFIKFIPYIVSLALFVMIRRVTGAIFFAPRSLQLCTVLFMALGVLFFLASCLQLRLTSKSQIVKLRARMILLGFAISATLPVAESIANALFDIYLVQDVNYYLPLFLVFPTFVGYSIVKHNLFDIDALIKRTYGYVLTTGTLAAIYGSLVLIYKFTFGDYEVTKSSLFSLVFILTIVFLLNPLRARLQLFVDRMFYRLEYDYQTTVHEISETMRSLLDLAQIGRNIMDTALQTMFIDHGYVLLLGRDGKIYECLAEAGIAETSNSIDNQLQVAEANATCNNAVTKLKIPTDEPLIGIITVSRKQVTLYDIDEDPIFMDCRESCRRIFDLMQAQLLIPLIYEDRLIGLISLGRKKSGKFYRREDINLLNVLANQGAVAIENARMVEELIEKERMDEELSIARDLQISMLPTKWPKIEHFEIAATSLSAREVGGDFYDFIEMADERLGIVIADVAGKGVSGALVMSASRSIFRLLSEEVCSVANNMIKANQRLKRDVKSGMFVALLYAVLDSRNRTITLCSAGQTQPIFSNKDGKALLIETKGDTFPLGIIDTPEYEDTVLMLSTGDVVVLYTDGIVEAMNTGGEIFGFDRLIETIGTNPTTSAESLLQIILDQIKSFTFGAAQHDDLTLIVVRTAK